MLRVAAALETVYGPAPVAPALLMEKLLYRQRMLAERLVNKHEKLEEVLQDWEAVIGLEIHCELTKLETKMFCGCKLEFGAEPNTHTCPVCLGLPGALPVPNKAAIESIVLAGLATNCDIEKHSMFYRKNYMYPDMAKEFPDYARSCCLLYAWSLRSGSRWCGRKRTHRY